MRGKITKIIVILILIVLAGLIGVSTYTNQQQKTTSSKAAENDSWNACNSDFSNAPCGVCNVSSMNNGQVAFSCRLVCSGTGETCPGGVGTQKITGKWDTCSNTGEETCDSSKTDFKQEGVVQSSPWTLTRGENGDFTGTFPEIQCGRVNVELLMDAPGVDVTEAVYDSLIACNLPTSTITPSLGLSPSITPTVTPAFSPTPQLSPTLMITAALTPTPTSTITPSPRFSATATPTSPKALPQSGVPAPILFIGIPLLLVLLGLAF